MAAVEITISGILYDKLNRTQQQVVLIGDASLTGLGVGGGPMPPGSGNRPTHPIALPGDPWWGDPHPAHPIVIPPPGWTPPGNITVPPPGSPPVMLPGDHPTHPMVAPPFIVVEYPGMGPVIVPQPVPQSPTPAKK